MVREGRVLISSVGDPDFGSNYYVTAYEVGAQVTSASSGNTITVRAGHGFVSGDKFILNLDDTTLRTVDTAGATTITMTGAETLSVAQDDLLVNLADDTGSGPPNYDGNGLAVYSDMGYNDQLTDNTIQTDSNGRYRYWHKGIARWELVRDSSGDPFAIYQDTDSAPTPSSVKYANLEATGGIGTSGSPWTGWGGSVAANTRTIFPPGYYSVTEAVSLSTGSHVDCSPGAIFIRSASYLGVNVFNTGGAAITDFSISGARFDSGSLVVSGYDILIFEGCSRFSIRACSWVNIDSRTQALCLVANNVPSVTTSFFKFSDCLASASSNATTTLNSFIFYNCSDFEVSDNTIVGWGAIKCENIQAGTSYNHKILRNTFRDVDQTCIFSRVSGGAKIFGLWCVGNESVHTVAMTTAKGLYILNGSLSGTGGTIYNAVISQNISKGSVGHGIEVGANDSGTQPNIYGLSVSGNVIDGRLVDETTVSSQSRGISIVQAYGLSVTGNVIKYTGMSGIMVGANDARDVVITGNKIEYPVQYASAAPDASQESGIAIWQAARCLVDANSVYNPANSTLIASYATHGIYVQKTSDYVHVRNNVVIDDRGASRGLTNGIRIGDTGAQTSPNASTVVGNYVSGYLTSAILHQVINATVKCVYSGNITDTGSVGISTVAAGALTLPAHGDYFVISGNTNITSVTASWPGRRVVLNFSGTPTFTDGSNLKLAGDLVATADDTITIVCDGTDWIETGRSVN